LTDKSMLFSPSGTKPPHCRALSEILCLFTKKAKLAKQAAHKCNKLNVSFRNFVAFLPCRDA
ncbi:hypothetical protein, partial [Escherichia coli]|uniref:hypothetical protein n=1 Tax=Escherichia coli TaxID=562 RepID=UPI0019682156